MIRLFFTSVLLLCIACSCLAAVYQQQSDSLKNQKVLDKVTNYGSAAKYFFQKNNLDSAILFYDSANQLIQSYDLTDLNVMQEIKNNYGIALAYLQQHVKSIEIFKELNTYYRNNNKAGIYNKQIAKIYNNIAINYNYIYDLEQSLRYFDSCLVYFRKDNLLSTPEMQRIYHNKALNYLDIGNYQAAAENLELSRFIRVANENGKEDKYTRMSEQLIYSEVLLEINKGEKDVRDAIRYLNEAHRIIMEINPNDYYVAPIFNLLSKAYLMLHEYDSSLMYSRKIYDFYKQQYGDKYPGFVFRHKEHGKIFRALNLPDSALYYFDKAASMETAVDVNRTYYKTEALLEMAAIYIENGEIERALPALEKAAEILFPGYSNANDVLSNPSAEYISSNPFNSTFFIKKGELLYKIFKQNDDQNYLNAAMKSYTVGIREGMKSRKSLVTIRSKAIYSTRLYNYFDRAMEIADTIYKRNRSTENFNQLLWVSDQSKSATLKDFIRSKSDFSLGVPSEILARELDLKSQVNMLEQTIFKENINRTILSGTANESKIQKLVDVKVELENFMADLSKKYPHYFKMMYGHGVYEGATQFSQTTVNTKNLKEYLIVDYYEGVADFFIQYVKGSKKGVIKVTKTKELISAIARLKKCLDHKAEINYQADAYFIYQKLLHPVVENVDTKKIIIIPDGILAYIPFEVLVNEVIDGQNNFKDFRYLIHTYQISYQHALSLVKNAKKGNKAIRDNTFLAMAPDFESKNELATAQLDEGSRSGAAQLVSLPFAKKEVSHLATLFDGEYLLDEDATETNFKRMAMNADVIHLATHSVINDDNPMMSRLVFAADDENDGLLHTYELFSLDLRADLVCLSACNSGLGELQRGEGVVSLARGFLYANAANVLMSLWSVPDESTSNVMATFYQEIKAGVSYQKAIRHAKLEYLSTADNNLAHPYYWGAFVYVGDVENESSYVTLWILLFVVLTSLLVLVFRRRKLQRSK